MFKKSVDPRITWLSNARIASSRLPAFATFIPIVGYAILWSDGFKEFFDFSQSLGNPSYLTANQRLYLLYFGALIASLGWLLYERYCPRQIKKYPNSFDYIKAVTETYDFYEIWRAVRYIKKSHWKEELEHHIDNIREPDPSNWSDKEALALDYSIKQILSHFHFLVDFERGTLARITYFLFMLGGTLIAIPSIEVFVMVLQKFLSGLVS